MDSLDPSALQVVGGFLMLAGLFVLREIVCGALKEVGKDLWAWAKNRLSTQRHHAEKGSDYG